MWCVYGVCVCVWCVVYCVVLTLTGAYSPRVFVNNGQEFIPGSKQDLDLQQGDIVYAKFKIQHLNFPGKNSKTGQPQQVVGLKLIITDVFIIQKAPRQQNQQYRNY